VSDPSIMGTVAGALVHLGVERALVVSSDDGLDELSTVGPTEVVEVRGGALERYRVTPEDVGLARIAADALAGGDPAANAATTRAILAGDQGAPRDLAAFNAGAAIYAGGRADTLEAGVRAAETAIDSGAAATVLDRYITTSAALAPSAP